LFITALPPRFDLTGGNLLQRNIAKSYFNYDAKFSAQDAIAQATRVTQTYGKVLNKRPLP
jgi:hypothetical protein